MLEKSTVELTVTITDPELDDHEKQSLTQNLIKQLGNIDGVEQVERTKKVTSEKGERGGNFLLGMLSAEVNIKNIKAVLGFLGDRIGNKPIKIKVKVGDKEVEMEASSREEILVAEELAKKLLNSIQEDKNA